MKSFIELGHSKCDIEYEVNNIEYILKSNTQSDDAMDYGIGGKHWLRSWFVLGYILWWSINLTLVTGIECNHSFIDC